MLREKSMWNHMNLETGWTCDHLMHYHNMESGTPYIVISYMETVNTIWLVDYTVVCS